MADAEYLEILDWLARNTVAGKRGSTPAEAPAIFERLGIKSEIDGPADLVVAAVGWLAREEKLRIRNSGRSIIVSLH